MNISILIYLIVSTILIISMAWSARAYYNEYVEIPYNYLFFKKIQVFKGEDAKRFSKHYFTGSSLILIALSLYPIFGIKTGYFGLMMCSLGFIFWMLAFRVVSKRKDNSS